MENFETQPWVGLLSKDTYQATKFTPVTQRSMSSRKRFSQIQTAEWARYKQSYERSWHAKCFTPVKDQCCVAVVNAEPVPTKIFIQIGWKGTFRVFYRSIRRSDNLRLWSVRRRGSSLDSWSWYTILGRSCQRCEFAVGETPWNPPTEWLEAYKEVGLDEPSTRRKAKCFAAQVSDRSKLLTQGRSKTDNASLKHLDGIEASSNGHYQ